MSGVCDVDADGDLDLGLGGSKEEQELKVELESRKRERMREIALLKRQVEDDQMKEEEDDEIDEEEDDAQSEYESDSDDDDDPRAKALMKPVFVSKNARETVKEKEAHRKEEEEAAERQKERLKDRKVESKSILIDTIQKEEEAEREGLNMNDSSDVEMPDDDDEKNEAEEYELWKIRELKRIKRDKDEIKTREQELAEIERRRAMTDAEREADNRRLDAAHPGKRDEVKQFNFMQKYYHRGAHFQDKAVSGEEPLYLRDVHEPLANEQYDKNLLPQAMQLRRGQFGIKGQVKHTHLTDVDTTDMTAAWAQSDKMAERYQRRMATAKGVNAFDRPTGSAHAGAPKLA